MEKSAFLILCQSENASQKIRKVCETFGAYVFNCPNTSNSRTAEIMALRFFGFFFIVVCNNRRPL